MNRPLFQSSGASTRPGRHDEKTIGEAVNQFLDTKRGEGIADMAHYEGFFERELLPWCHGAGIHWLDELSLEQATKFRNTLRNKGTVKNRKVARLRTFFQFCCDRRWTGENPAKNLKPSQEDDPDVDYFRPDEMRALEDACFVSHNWERGRDFAYRARRLRALILFLRWTGLAIVDSVRFQPERLRQNPEVIWTVMLRRQKNGNSVFVAIPPRWQMPCCRFHRSVISTSSGPGMGNQLQRSEAGAAAWIYYNARDVLPTIGN